MKLVATGFGLALALSSCSKDESKKVSYDTKLRSTGKATVALKGDQASAVPLVGNSMTANSAVDLEYFKVPISVIRLTAGFGASGYTESSPDFYSCTGTDEECAVNLLDSSLDTLLSGSSSGTFVLDSEKTYTGVAVEHCSGTDTQGMTYNIFLKGSVLLSGTTYYTNKANGLSATGPAEEATITVDCMGSNSMLVEPVTVAPEGSVSLVFYADPSANVFATDGMANSNCTGTSPKICSNNVMIFGTVDSEKPTVERYLLDTAGAYSDVLVSMLFNKAGKPFGALMSEYYKNTAADQLLHTPTMSFNKITETSADKYDFQYGAADSLLTAMSNFERGPHSGSIDALVEEKTAYTATKF